MLPATIACRYGDCVIPNQLFSVGEVARSHARQYPDSTAVVCDEHRLLWPEFELRATKLANALKADGFGAGDRLLWLGQNCHRLLECFVAVAKLGGMLCPANWRSSATEIAFVIDDLDPHTILWQSAEIGDVVAEARGLSSAAPRWIQHDTADNEGYDQYLANGSTVDDDCPVDASSALLLLYTAAYAGRPNAAMLSHNALISHAAIIADLQRIDPNFAYLNCGPMFHIGTWMSTLGCLLYGGTNVMTPRASAEEICRLIDAEHVNAGFVVSPTIEQILELNRDGRYDLSSFQAATTSPEWAAMINTDSAVPYNRASGGYGQTEAGGMLTFRTLGLGGLGSHGRPSPIARVRFVDPDGAEVPDGEVGEFLARGTTIMNGYWRRDELNATKLANGWLHTGDLGRREKDGTISFVGPKGRLVKSGGENVYPIEVETCLRTHPAVRDVAVIGAPDPVWGQIVVAVAELHDGQAVRAEELVEHCRVTIASYKKPRRIHFVDALPRSGITIDYTAVIERFAKATSGA